MIHTSSPHISVCGDNGAQTESLSSPSHHSDQKLVLIMEDDDDCLLITTYTLELLGYRCLSTQNSGEALCLARNYHPDLFLLDIVMPDVDGIEVYHQLRQLPECQACPMIAVTALAMDRERAQILAAGFDDFLSKPFFLQDLARMMHRHLPPPHSNLEQDLRVFEPQPISAMAPEDSILNV